jgi:asparagine synthase (glutamine-hydrolysing)
MCGFSGWFDPTPLDRSILEKMTEAIAHRGPDGFGYYLEGPVAFGHRRLAIIDVETSSQPMLSQNKRYALVYNGELYNFVELRAELESLGRTFRTQGDTEVVLQALEEWDIEALRRFEGIFAFAFWDNQEESLLLARDHVGVKPLHIAWDGKRLIFGSEIKALLAHPAISHEIDTNALALYLECQYIPAPLTIFQSIRKLAAAHWMRCKKGQLTTGRYWLPSYLPKYEMDDATALQELSALLHKSVSSMLVSDVPLGAFLSGGIDSSLVAALMQKTSGKKIKTFHIGFEQGLPSEHEHAEKVASYLGTEHYPLMVTTKDVLSVMDEWVDTFDEPFGDQAALPTLLLSRLTKQHVTVVLTGEGADEVFAGYTNYGKRLKEAGISRYLGSSFSPLRWLYPLFPAQLRKNRLFKTFGRPRSRRYTTVSSLYDIELRKSYFHPALHRSMRLEHLAAAYFSTCDSPEALDQMLHVDLNLWLADDLLAKVDRATMAHSIEARVPYLAPRLIEFAARLPSHHKLRGSTTKYLLKQVALQGLLPPEIVLRPKSGFVLPLREWIQGDLKGALDDTLSASGLMSRNIVRPGVIERLRLEEAHQTKQHATRLWALHTLELWLRKYAPDYKIN